MELNVLIKFSEAKFSQKWRFQPEKGLQTSSCCYGDQNKDNWNEIDLAKQQNKFLCSVNFEKTLI